MGLLWVILFISVSTVFGVDRSKFRTCQQTSFCGRQRDQSAEDRAAFYHVLADSIDVSKTGVLTANLQLVDSRYDEPPKPLELSVSLILNDVVRVRVREREPIRPRYEVQDVVMERSLAGNPNVGAFDIDKSANSVSVTFGASGQFKFVVTVAPEPFRAELYIDGEHTTSLNGEQLMKFEAYRERAPSTPSATDGEATVDCEMDDGGKCIPGTGGEAGGPEPEPASKFPEDKPGMWEESFGGHTDKKPFGPASVGMDISFLNVENFYGIPEHASSFSLKTTKDASGSGGYSEPFRLFNLDVFEYELDEPMALYGSVPMLVAHGPSRTTGVFWLNGAETFVDVYDPKSVQWFGAKHKTSHWMSESGVIDVYLLPGPTPTDVSYQYAFLTGFPQMPPMFATAYHQCRWNYRNEEDVKEVDAKFDEHDIPVDVIWLDIEHTDGKKYFTWDSNHFPNPEEMQRQISVKGRKMVVIIDPHIKDEAGYYVHNDALANDYFVKKADGSVYDGWCWPGKVNYLDFLSEKCEDYWAGLFALDKYKGSTEFLFAWNDMNEPSVFNGPEVTMPKDCVHAGGVEHRDIHNLYGMHFHKATFEGILRRSDSTRRPFVLTRAFYAGSQRFGAVWTGDNKASWDHLTASVPMLLSHGIAGITFIGADVGGFFGNPDPELLLRWYQVAAFQPFFRGHAHIDTDRREPWVHEGQWTGLNRAAIRARYTFLPYIYTLFYETSVTGKPMMRPLWYEYPKDVATFKIDDEFLLGSDLLIKPITSQGATQTNVYFPGGAETSWLDIKSGQKYIGGSTASVDAPLEKLPVFQRSGSIIPRKIRSRRSSSFMKNDPYTLEIVLDSKGEASGLLYEDDGESFDFQRGAYILRSFKFSGRSLSSMALQAGIPGSDPLAARTDPTRYKSACDIERLVISGLGDVKSVTISQVDNAERDLDWRLSDDTGSIVVKKPKVNVGDDFEIKFS
eukprot:239870_1